MEQDRPEDRVDVAGLLGGIGRQVAGRVREQVDAARTDPAVQSPRAAAASVVRGLAGEAGDLVAGVRQDVAGAVRAEAGALRDEVLTSARAGARGAGLVGAAAATGNAAVLFTGVAVWRGLGNRIGYARSAAVVAALSAAATAALASAGAAELARVRARRPGRAPDRPRTPRSRPHTGSTTPPQDPGATGTAQAPTPRLER